MSGNLSRSTSWAGATSWLLGAGVLRSVGLIAILVVLARFSPQETVGRYALALAVTTPIFTFAQLGLRSIYLTIRKQYRYVSFLLVQSGAVIVAVAASALVTLAFDSNLVPIVLLVAAIKSVDSFSELASGPMQGIDRTPQIFWTYLTSAVLGTAAITVALAWGAALEVALACLALVSLVVAAIALWLPALRIQGQGALVGVPPTGAREFREILRAGLPTGLASALLALVSSFPQYVLGYEFDAAAVGHLAVILYVLAIADIFFGTLAQAWISRGRALLRPSGESQAIFRRAALRATALWMAIAFPLTIAALLVFSHVLPLTFGSEYTLGIGAAIPLGVAVLLFPAVHFGWISIAIQNYYVHGITLSATAAVASLAACLVLIPALGLEGALWATVVALLVRGASAFAIVVIKSRTETFSEPHSRGTTV